MCINYECNTRNRIVHLSVTQIIRMGVTTFPKMMGSMIAEQMNASLEPKKQPQNFVFTLVCLLENGSLLEAYRLKFQSVTPDS